MSAKPNDPSQVIRNLSSASAVSTSRIENDQNNVDVRLRLLLKNNLIPKSPYILTVPSDYPYSRLPTQRYNWRVNSPFALHEEQLQYLSFLYREVTHGVLLPVGEWDTEDVMDKGKPSTNNTRSGTATPSNGKKIKMSLSDYVTNKPKAGMATKTGQDLEASGDVNGTTKEPPKEASPQSSKRSEKRPANAMADHQPHPADHNPKADCPSPAKKARQSPAPQPKPVQPPTAKAAPPKPRPNLLPPLLSPTLPPSIEAELARIERLELSKESKNPSHQKSNSTASSSSDNKNLSSSHTSSPNSTKSLRNERRNVPSPKPPENSKKEPPPIEPPAKKQPATSEARAVPSRPEAGAKPAKREPQQSSFFNSLRGISSPALGSAPGTKPEKTETRKDKLIVKLKYGKGNRVRVQRLLNTKSQPRKTSETKPVSKDGPREEPRHERDHQRDKEGRGEKPQERQDDQKSRREPRGANSKDTEKVRQKESLKPSEKRPRPTDEERPREPPAKRQRAPDTLSSRKVRTPAAPTFKSPAMSNVGNGQKDQDVTPKKQGQATASAPMHRVGSSETHARTPQAPPGSAEKVNGNGRDAYSSMPVTGGGKRINDSLCNKDIDTWRHDIMKYNLLGKDLKRHADTLFNQDDEQKRALAAGLESVFCYMIAFTVEDIKNSSSGSGERAYNLNWPSILPFLHFVTRRARPFPLLFGLSQQLSAVCYEMVLNVDIDHLAKLPLPDPARQEEFVKFKNGLVENARTVKMLWRAGLSTLSADELQKNFPETWAKRAKTMIANEEWKEAPGKYGGSYHLPLNSCSTALEAVRMGHSVLREWCKNEKVDYSSKVILN